MKIILQSGTTTTDFKNQFHSFFPFLKIEFFKKAHETNETSKQKELIKEDFLLANLSSRIKNSELEFTPLTTVAEFEKTVAELITVLKT